jgi:hypothetical protein
MLIALLSGVKHKIMRLYAGLALAVIGDRA